MSRDRQSSAYAQVSDLLAGVVQWQNISFPRRLDASGDIRLRTFKVVVYLRIPSLACSVSFGVVWQRPVTSLATSNVTTSRSPFV